MDESRLMDPAKIARALEARNVVEVAAATGLHTNTIYKWRRNEVKLIDPGTWAKLSDYLTGEAAR